MSHNWALSLLGSTISSVWAAENVCTNLYQRKSHIWRELRRRSSLPFVSSTLIFLMHARYLLSLHALAHNGFGMGKQDGLIPNWKFRAVITGSILLIVVH